MNKITVSIEPIKKGTWKLYFDGNTKPISAHRFTQLMGWEKYVTKSDLFLDFYGLKITPITNRLTLGSTMEETILEYEYSDDVYIHYEMTKENKGNIINPNGEEDVNGIPDAIVLTRGSLGECKVTTSPVEECRENWYKQAQFYAYFWNKYMAEDTGFKIDYIEILTYYVPDKMIDYQIQNKNAILLENYCKFVFELDKDIEKDITEAKLRKKELIDSGLVVRDNHRRILWEIAVGVLNKKIKFKYDKHNKQAKEFIDIINSLVKEERKKLNEIN